MRLLQRGGSPTSLGCCRVFIRRRRHRPGWVAAATLADKMRLRYYRRYSQARVNFNVRTWEISRRVGAQRSAAAPLLPGGAVCLPTRKFHAFFV